MIDDKLNALQRKLQYPYMIDMEWSGNDGQFKWYIVDCRDKSVVGCFECFEDMEDAIEDPVMAYKKMDGRYGVKASPKRKCTRMERECRKTCFYCIHRKGKGLDEHCDRNGEKIYWDMDDSCDDFSRNWKFELFLMERGL